METTALQCSCTARTPALASGANTAKEFRRTAVRISQTGSWSLHVSDHRLLMSSEYSDRRGGGAGDFVVGVLLAGAAFGALAYILAPQGPSDSRQSHLHSKISKSVDNLSDRAAAKRATWFLEDEGLQRTLNVTIAQLNAAIDKILTQLRAKESRSTSSGTTVELEPAA